MNKNELRKRFKDLRSNMSDLEVRKKSKVIVDKFLSMHGNYEKYLLYYSFNNEVRTIELISHLRKEKKKIYLPILHDDEFYVGEFTDFSEMNENVYGIFEPTEKLNVCEFDVVVVPGLAFDEECYRLGFGKGYYDRFLKSVKRKICVGFAYDFQVVKKLPVDNHDEKLDLIITEKRILGGE
ncbi:5-formyltetrahydrofolate cyclo-ligase [Deferribacter autotrophicus]|uniref:5-formyltetrahydrofolate cyclo-ligase n=1 Tax=Deferribacter autotrophicus TaxID=500465 RepID=A0A5A8F576_9BACT|nr:5-formyltetrahydrofolate cyclo-ligase [Deferribacter autotrophicus]KAA0257007.1 5-formyltetrahydrofolate cyclo-ligase [Deferribacter autotrophicus]